MFVGRFQKLMHKIQDSLDTNQIYSIRNSYTNLQKFCRGHHRIFSHLLRHLKASRYDRIKPSYKYDVEKAIKNLETINEWLFELSSGKVARTMIESADTLNIKSCFKERVRPLIESIEDASQKTERYTRKHIRDIRMEIKNSVKLLADLEEIEHDIEDFE